MEIFKVHMLQSVCVAKYTCCKGHVLQSAHVAKCTCYKVHVLLVNLTLIHVSPHRIKCGGCACQQLFKL